MAHDEKTTLFVRRRRVLKAVGSVRLPDVLLSDTKPCTIGRVEGNDIVIPNDAVSRSHARIDPRGADLVIRDLGSSNGLHVNGMRVTEKTLVDRDTIAIGECVFEYQDRDEPPVPRAPAPVAPSDPAPLASAPPAVPAPPRAARAGVQPPLKMHPPKTPSLRLPSLRLPALRLPALTVPRASKHLRLALVGVAVLCLALVMALVVGGPHGGSSPERGPLQPMDTPKVKVDSPPPPSVAPSDRELDDPNVQQAKIFHQKGDYGLALAAVQRAIGSGFDTPTARDLRGRIAKEYEAALNGHLKRADDLERQLQYQPALGALGAAHDLIGELEDPRAAEIKRRILVLQSKAGR